MTEDRKLGISLTLALALVGGLMCWRHHPTVSLVFGILAIVSFVAFLAAPALMRYPRAVLKAIGWFNGQLILSLVFFLVFTPVGVLMRLFGKDPLEKSWHGSASYWVLRKREEYDPRSAERQY